MKPTGLAPLPLLSNCAYTMSHTMKPTMGGSIPLLSLVRIACQVNVLISISGTGTETLHVRDSGTKPSMHGCTQSNVHVIRDPSQSRSPANEHGQHIKYEAPGSHGKCKGPAKYFLPSPSPEALGGDLASRWNC